MEEKFVLRNQWWLLLTCLILLLQLSIITATTFPIDFPKKNVCKQYFAYWNWFLCRVIFPHSVFFIYMCGQREVDAHMVPWDQNHTQVYWQQNLCVFPVRHPALARVSETPCWSGDLNSKFILVVRSQIARHQQVCFSQDVSPWPTDNHSLQMALHMFFLYVYILTSSL